MDKLCVLVILAALALGVFGCSSNNPASSPATVTDQQAVTQMVTSIDSVSQFLSSEEATINDGGLQLVDAGGVEVPGAVRSAERPSGINTTDSVVEWGRVVFPAQIVRDYNVLVIGDTIAIVTITKHVPGQFLVAWGIRPVPPTDSVIVDTVIRKSFTEVMSRKVQLKRIAHTDNPLMNWVPTAMTFVASKTAGSITFGIDSLEISDNRTSFDSTYSNPLQTWFRFGRYRESIPIFHVGDTVLVRLTVSGSDSLPEIVALHHSVLGSASLPVRLRMFLVSQSGGPGNYTRVFQRRFVAWLPPAVLVARFNALADVFPRRCIYSQTAAFENEFWGLPYIVTQ